MPDAGDQASSLPAHLTISGDGRMEARHPASFVYEHSCKHFRWPLLAPQALEEPGPLWQHPPPPAKLEARMRMVSSFAGFA